MTDLPAHNADTPDVESFRAADIFAIGVGNVAELIGPQGQRSAVFLDDVRALTDVLNGLEPRPFNAPIRISDHDRSSLMRLHDRVCDLGREEIGGEDRPVIVLLSAIVGTLSLDDHYGAELEPATELHDDTSADVAARTPIAEAVNSVDRDLSSDVLPPRIMNSEVPGHLAVPFNSWEIFSENASRVAGTQWESEWRQERQALFMQLGENAIDVFGALNVHLLDESQRATIERAMVDVLVAKGWKRVDPETIVEVARELSIRGGLLEDFSDWHYPDHDADKPYTNWLPLLREPSEVKRVVLTWGVPDSLIQGADYLVPLEHRADFARVLRQIEGEQLLGVSGVGRFVASLLPEHDRVLDQDLGLMASGESVATELLTAGLARQRSDLDQAVVAANLEALLDGLSGISSQVQDRIWTAALSESRDDSMSPLLDVMLNRVSQIGEESPEYEALRVLVAELSVKGDAAMMISRLGVERWSDMATAAVSGQLELPYRQAVEAYGADDVNESLAVQLRSFLRLGSEIVGDKTEIRPRDVLAVSRLVVACYNDASTRHVESGAEISQRYREALSYLQRFLANNDAMVREFLGLQSPEETIDTDGDVR